MPTNDAVKVLALADVERLPGCGFEAKGQFLMTELKLVEKPVLVATVAALETATKLSEDRSDLIGRLEARCRTLTQDADEKRAWMMARDEMAARLESMTRSRDAADKAFEELQRKLVAMETENDELSAKLESMTRERDQASQIVDECSQSIRRHEKERGELWAQLETAARHLADIRSVLGLGPTVAPELLAPEVTKQLSDQALQRHEALESLSELRSQVRNAAGLESPVFDQTIVSKIQAIRRNLDKTTEAHDELWAKLQETRAERDQLRAQIKTMEDRDRTWNHIKALSAERDAMAKRLADIGRIADFT